MQKIKIQNFYLIKNKINNLTTKSILFKLIIKIQNIFL